jgi:hypothetical protein
MHGKVSVAKEKRKYWLILGFLIFVVYTFTAAQTIPEETILVPRWLSSLETNYSVSMGDEDSPASVNETSDRLLPFQLGNRFGYVDTQGHFSINQAKTGYVSLSDQRWAEYDAIPETIEIRNPANESLGAIEKGRGYPLFLDGQIYLLGETQNSLSLADEEGKLRWTRDFPAPLTSIDAAAGMILTGSLDGTVELLDTEGRRLFFFEPGGSRLSVILSCRVSRDGRQLAVISGIDDQRFLLLEGFGDSYKIVYHEFLEDGFRRAVHLAFVDNDNRIVYEREGGLGIYDIGSRQSISLPLEGEVIALDETGTNGLLFAVISLGGPRKNLAVIRLPGTLIMQAPFKSETAFLSRRGSHLYVGGGMTLASFELDMR